MNKLLKKISLTVAAVAAVSTCSTAAFAVDGVVTASGSLRLRAESNTSAAILDNLPTHTVVEVTAVTENGWFQVNHGGKTGFVSGDYLSVGAEEVAALPFIKDPTYGVVSAGPLNIRAGAGTGETVVKIVNQGTVLTILDDSNSEWFETEDGFVSKQYVDQISKEEADAMRATSTVSSRSTNGVADYAKTLLGSRYVYGGTSTNGFDCSGFVQYVFKNFGVSLNRTSRDQFSNGVAVSKSDLQAGDVVFFAKSGSSISHVGIYIGNNEFIHASTPATGVIISSMSSSYYTSGYVGARRML